LAYATKYATIEDFITDFSMKQVESLSEIASSKSFFIDTNFTSSQFLLHFPVYPVNKRKINLTHDLLSLFGIHWRYLINNNNICEVHKDNGDLNIVIENLKKGIKKHRFAFYAFTQKYVNAHKSLWYFVPHTLGWEYYNDLLLPRFKDDIRHYESLKQEIRDIK